VPTDSSDSRCGLVLGYLDKVMSVPVLQQAREFLVVQFPMKDSVLWSCSDFDPPTEITGTVASTLVHYVAVSIGVVLCYIYCRETGMAYVKVKV